jgi:hypothetical protein
MDSGAIGERLLREEPLRLQMAQGVVTRVAVEIGEIVGWDKAKGADGHEKARLPLVHRDDAAADLDGLTLSGARKVEASGRKRLRAFAGDGLNGLRIVQTTAIGSFADAFVVERAPGHRSSVEVARSGTTSCANP